MLNTLCHVESDWDEVTDTLRNQLSGHREISSFWMKQKLLSTQNIYIQMYQECMEKENMLK